MKKAWSIVLAIAFVCILLGAIAIGVGYLTGADLETVYTTLEGTQVADYIGLLIRYWNTGFAYVQQFVADFPNLVSGLF